LSNTWRPMVRINKHVTEILMWGQSNPDETSWPKHCFYIRFGRYVPSR